MPLHPFEMTVSIVGTIVAGIMILAIFFTILGKFRRPKSELYSSEAIEKALINAGEVTIHMRDGTTFPAGSIASVSSGSIGGDETPWKLYPFLVLQHHDGAKTFIRLKQIRMIKASAPTK